MYNQDQEHEQRVYTPFYSRILDILAEEDLATTLHELQVVEVDGYRPNAGEICEIAYQVQLILGKEEDLANMTYDYLKAEADTIAYTAGYNYADSITAADRLEWLREDHTRLESLIQSFAPHTKPQAFTHALRNAIAHIGEVTAFDIILDYILEKAKELDTPEQEKGPTLTEEALTYFANIDHVAAKTFALNQCNQDPNRAPSHIHNYTLTLDDYCNAALIVQDCAKEGHRGTLPEQEKSISLWVAQTIRDYAHDLGEYLLIEWMTSNPNRLTVLKNYPHEFKDASLLVLAYQAVNSLALLAVWSDFQAARNGR